MLGALEVNWVSDFVGTLNQTPLRYSPGIGFVNSFSSVSCCREFIIIKGQEQSLAGMWKNICMLKFWAAVFSQCVWEFEIYPAPEPKSGWMFTLLLLF